MRSAFAQPRLLAFVALVGCSARANTGAPAPLENTYGLVELGGQPALGPGGDRAPHLRFVLESGRVVGYTGCNQLSGPFTRDGATLRFGPTMVTRMACLDPRLNQQEGTFLAALNATERHEIAGETLTLIGADGPLARLSVRPK